MRIIDFCCLAIGMLSLTLAGCAGSTDSSTTATFGAPPKEPVDFRAQVPLGELPEFNGSPTYGILLDGITPKTVAWIAVDDSYVYIDRNQDGIFQEDETTPLPEDSGKVTLGELGPCHLELQRRSPRDFSGKEIDWASLDPTLAKRFDEGWQLWTLRRIDNQDPIDIQLWLSPSPANAVATHANGPLIAKLVHDPMILSREEPLKFDVKFGTSEYVGRSGMERTFASLLTSENVGDPSPVAKFQFRSGDSDEAQFEMIVTLVRRC